MIRWNFINLQHTRQDGDSLTNASVAERSEVWMQARPKDHDGSILGLALGSRRCDIRPSDATLARQVTHLSALQWLISHTFSSLVSPRCLLWYGTTRYQWYHTTGCYTRAMTHYFPTLGASRCVHRAWLQSIGTCLPLRWYGTILPYAKDGTTTHYQ